MEIESIQRGAVVTVTLDPQLETALVERARAQGISAETLAHQILRESLVRTATPVAPSDEWERSLLEIGTDCGVSLPHSALCREALYE